MDKDDVEYIVALYKYLHDPKTLHDKNWKKNIPQPKPKFKGKEQLNISNEIIKTKDDIKSEEIKENDKEDIKKTLNFLKQEIERIENLIK
jgi:hypothetical protein